MGKYVALQTDIFSLFDSASWKAENIKAFPANTVASGTETDYIRIDIVPSDTGVNINSVSGVLIIDIFTSAGDGPNKMSLIADKLDSYLVGKTFAITPGRSTQFKNSNLGSSGPDKANPALNRVEYTIPFIHSGV